MRSLLFWDFTQRKLVLITVISGQPIRLIFKDQAVQEEKLYPSVLCGDVTWIEEHRPQVFENKYYLYDALENSMGKCKKITKRELHNL